MGSVNNKQIRNLHARNYIQAVFADRLKEEGFVCPNDKLFLYTEKIVSNILPGKNIRISCNMRSIRKPRSLPKTASRISKTWSSAKPRISSNSKSGAYWVQIEGTLWRELK